MLGSARKSHGGLVFLAPVLLVVQIRDCLGKEDLTDLAVEHTSGFGRRHSYAGDEGALQRVQERTYLYVAVSAVRGSLNHTGCGPKLLY